MHLNTGVCFLYFFLLKVTNFHWGKIRKPNPDTSEKNKGMARSHQEKRAQNCLAGASMTCEDLCMHFCLAPAHDESSGNKLRHPSLPLIFSMADLVGPLKTTDTVLVKTHSNTNHKSHPHQRPLSKTIILVSVSSIWVCLFLRAP